MITNISITTVFVKDVDESKRFYTDVLGFEEKDDVVMGDYRWCTVVHPNQPELMVHLNIPGPPFSPEMVEAINRSLDGGGMNGLGLSVDDCHATVADLKAKGVHFVHPPQPVNRGDRLELWSATFRDPDDHNIAITQLRAIR